MSKTSSVPCTNCNKNAPVHQMLTVSSVNRPIVRICPACQNAKKVKITLARDGTGEGPWQYYQFSVLEG